ncbi:MAG: Phytoene desaturase (neurosporene-forming) [Firmicutes bacterium ADurb.Bin419]|nr:MAG: Phytoene desaturase (neurosporene-forming) [Firmicutes bacterium ADurb.Bin419]
MPVEKFVTLFKSQFLREAIVGLMSFLPRYPALYVLMIFGHMHTGNANYPSGGSIGVAKAMEKRYLKLGGKINYNSKVESIVVKDNKAVGVKLADGKEHAADFVVSAADGYNTIFKMLEGKYISKKLERQYKTLPIFHSYMQVSFGVSCDLSQEPRFIVHKLGEPLVVGNQQIKDIRIRHYCFDASFAPLGKTSLVVTFACDYDYWNNIYSDYKYYVSEKERIKDRILSELCKRFPGISEKIEVYDIATPKTFERFSGNRKGAAEGWYVDSKTVDTSFERSLKGLLNFYMAGHWVEISGGIPFAVLSGRNAIQMICHKEKKKFRTCNS